MRLAIFLDLMAQQKFMDLASRSGKQSGGYCEFIDGIQMPFIFANFAIVRQMMLMS